MLDNKLTTREAAEKTGRSLRMVQRFIQEGRLPAEKFGRDWVIKEKDLKKLNQFLKKPRKKKP